MSNVKITIQKWVRQITCIKFKLTLCCRNGSGRIYMSFCLLFLSSTLLFAQKTSSRVRDSLLMEKAYRNSDTQYVTKMLNKWSLKSISNKKVPFNKDKEVALEVYHRFFDDFMQGKLVGLLHNRDNPYCRFIKSPYLFLQPQFKYIYVGKIPDSLQRDILKIAKLAVSPYPNLYQDFDAHYTLSEIEKIADTIQNIPVQIDQYFYKKFRNKYDILPISAKEDYRKCLVNFWGYIDIRKGVTALRDNGPSAEQRTHRLDFLNKVLCSDKPAAKIIYFGSELEIGRIFILDNMQYAAVTYSIMLGCSYVALYKLDKLDDKAYIPISYCMSVE